jgi:sec-independent protein translocase protein TatC
MALPLFNRKNADNEEMSFVDHLEALRWHILRSVLAVLACAIVIFINIDWIFDHIIMGPIRSDFVTYISLCKFSHWAHLGDALCMPAMDVKMQTTTFSSQFMSAISIGFIGGVMLAFPYIFWEIWRFIKPALSAKEIKSSRGAIVFVSFFFFLGIAFGYFMLAPFTFNFLFGFKLGTQQILETKPTLDDYIENITNVLLGTGIAFELPVVAYVLTRIGLVNSKFLKQYRKYAIVIILVVAAVITPSPDWMSQTIVFIPLYALYEFSIFISKRVEGDEAKKEAEWS